MGLDHDEYDFFPLNLSNFKRSNAKRGWTSETMFYFCIIFGDGVFLFLVVSIIFLLLPSTFFNPSILLFFTTYDGT